MSLRRICLGALLSWGGNGQAAERSAVVEMERIQLKAYQEGAEYLGTLRSRRHVVLISHGGGRVQGLAVQAGDQVRAGASLCDIDRKRFGYDLEAARFQAEIARTQARLKERHQKSGSASTIEVLTTKSVLAEKEKNLILAQRLYDGARCYAPFPGVISHLKVQLHDELTPGTAVMELVDLRQLEVDVGVPEHEASLFRRGSKARAFFSQIPQGVAATVASLEQRVDPSSRSVRLWVHVDLSPDQASQVHTGATVNIELERRAIDSAVVIPSSAMMARQGRLYVAVAEQSVARIREVQVLTHNETESVIASGVRPGEFLITQGQHQLSDGDRVETIPKD